MESACVTAFNSMVKVIRRWTQLWPFSLTLMTSSCSPRFPGRVWNRLATRVPMSPQLQYTSETQCHYCEKTSRLLENISSISVISLQSRVIPSSLPTLPCSHLHCLFLSPAVLLSPRLSPTSTSVNLLALLRQNKYVCWSHFNISLLFLQIEYKHHVPFMLYAYMYFGPIF